MKIKIKISVLIASLLFGVMVLGGFIHPNIALAANTFYTTSVNDGLDANDRLLFNELFQELGYTFLGQNTNVSTSALNTLLSRSDISTLYHTGHGYDSGIATAGGSLSVGAVSGINTKNVIFATCLTLTSTTWKNKMNSSCANVLGYTNYSYDYVDDEVVTTFASKLNSGQTYIQAWYNANIAQSLLKDRWCGYVREGSSIVEYSARTRSTPKATTSSLTSMNNEGTLKVAGRLLDEKSKYDTYFYKIRNNEMRVKGGREHDAQFYHKGEDFLPKVDVTRDKAVDVASNWVSSDLPTDAVLESVIEIQVTGDSGVPEVVGEVVRYGRYMDGLPIRTNGAEDHIALLVNNNEVVAMSKIWPELDIQSKPGAIPNNKILSLSQAIQRASSQIAQLIKADQMIEIIDAKPCYGMTWDGTLVPAYELSDSQGGAIIVNAVTGGLIF